MIPNPFGFSYSDDIDISEMEQSIARLKRPQGRIDVVLIPLMRWTISLLWRTCFSQRIV